MKKVWQILLMLICVFFVLVITDIGCLIRQTTGFPCPGCGQMRAFLSLLSGDIVGAFTWHPLFWLTPILVILFLVKKEHIFKSKKQNTCFFIAIGVLYVLVYIWRMVTMFPNQAPMTIQTNAPLYQFIQFILHLLQ